MLPSRTFVNMVPLIDVTVTLGMKDKHPFCYISHPYVCPCLYGAGKSIWGGGTPLGRWWYDILQIASETSKIVPTLSKIREGMRRLQMGYVWELQNLVKSGRSAFCLSFFGVKLFHLWKLMGKYVEFFSDTRGKTSLWLFSPHSQM